MGNCQELSSWVLSEGPHMLWAVAGEWITPVVKAVFWLEFAFQCEWRKGERRAHFPFPTSQPVKLRQEASPQSHFP